MKQVHIKSIILTLFLLIQTICLLLAQNKKIDSLKNALESVKIDTQKVNTLNRLFFNLQYINPGDAEKYAREALALSKKIKFTKGQGNSHFSLAGAFVVQGKFKESEEQYQKAFDIGEEIGSDRLKSQGMNGIGVVYFYQGNFIKALEYFVRTLKINEEIGDEKLIVNALGNVGAIHTMQGNLDRALDYNMRALKLCRKNGDISGSITPLNNIAAIHGREENYEQSQKYFEEMLEISKQIKDRQSEAIAMINLGEGYLNLNKYDLALSYLKKALEITREIGDKSREASSLENIGQTYFENGAYEEALKYYQQAYEIQKSIDSKGQIPHTLNEIAKAHLSLGNYAEARQNLDMGLKMTYEINNVQTRVENFLIQSQLDSSQRRYLSALSLYQQHVILRDSLDKTNDKSSQRLALLETEFEIEKKETENDLLRKDQELLQQQAQRRNIIIYSFLGGLILLTMLAFVLVRSNNQQKKSNKLLAEKNDEISNQRDELADLNEELHQQKEEIEAQRDAIFTEQKKSDALLLNILPDETALELKETGKATPHYYEQASVLFTDFKGFTKLSEKLSPQKVIEELNYCFSAFDDICETHGIEKIKTIGDAFMAVGGVPVSDAENAFKTVQAGLAMQAFMSKWKDEKIAQGLPVWELRLGIHTGELIAGVVGKLKFSYDVWGDTVNLAARMESSGEVGKVNISGDTYEIVKSQFKCSYRGKIQAKSKGEVDMYFVEGILEANTLLEDPVKG